MTLSFEWDSRKARSNKKKHGITFEEASTVFGDILSITIDDHGHSVGEDRFVTVGTSVNDRLIVVVHTEHDDIILRIISARKATSRERKQYEQA